MNSEIYNLSRGVLQTIESGHCPTCNGRGFILGPQGGRAINIECANLECRARYNVTMFAGHVMMAEAIPKEDEGGPKWPVGEI